MGLSTHVLDSMHGTPAVGMQISLYRISESTAILLQQVTLNKDGRPPQGMLIAHADLEVGTYRLVFQVAPYFRALGVALPEPHFLSDVVLDIGVAYADQHYHVPLLVSPWSYSTYRGS